MRTLPRMEEGPLERHLFICLVLPGAAEALRRTGRRVRPLRCLGCRRIGFRKPGRRYAPISFRKPTMMRNLLFQTLVGMRFLSAQSALPTQWIDSDTGLRVIRLAREPGASSLDFHQNA